MTDISDYVHKGKWEKSIGRFSSGEFFKIGKVKVGSWFNPVVSKGSPIIYRAQIDLPGIILKQGTVDFDNQIEAMERVEHAVKTWLKWLDS